MTGPVDFYCSQLSREAGEQLFGTATHITTWFLLEYTGHWEAKAFEKSDLPAPVKQRLAEHLAMIPNSRIEMLRQGPHDESAKLAFYVALGREANPALYEFHLDSYDDLLALDLTAICEEDPAYNSAKREDPLFLVCTHGKRDKCCARYGLPVYGTLSGEEGVSVWQTSHVGGHRFAANVLCFPHGIYNGYVSPDNVTALANAYHAGQLYPATYRGRACYPKTVQAAEYFLRTSTGITGLDAFRLVGDERITDDEWLVRFAALAGGQMHDLRVQEQEVNFNTCLSCKDTEPSPVTQHALLSHTVNDPTT